MYLKFQEYFGSLVLYWLEIGAGKDYSFNTQQKKNK